MPSTVGSAGGSHDPTAGIPGRRNENPISCTRGRGEITVDKPKSAPKTNMGVVASGSGHTAGSKHVVTTRVGLSVARRTTALGTLPPRGD